MKWLMRILGKGKKKRAGFTLIELMIVVIVVAILAAAAIPIYWWAMARAYAAEARALLGAVRSVQQIYFAEHDDFEDYTTYVQGVNDDDTVFEQATGIKAHHNKWWHVAQLTWSSAATLDYGGLIDTGQGPWIIADGALGAGATGIQKILIALSLRNGTWVNSYDAGASYKTE